ncbi:MAG: hypothetical protein AAGE52_18305 [Myxococcota bacterium]
MAFRDENEALRQRVKALESELEDTRTELEELRKPPEVRVELEPEVAAPQGSSSSLAARVAAREAEEQRKARARELAAAQQKAEFAAKVAKREQRVVMVEEGDAIVLEVLPPPLKEQLVSQIPWGMVFAAINPGIFIVFGLGIAFSFVFALGLGASIFAAILTWLVLLFLLNLAFAHFVRPRFRITVDSENVEIVTRGKQLLGRRKDLSVDFEEGALGYAEFSLKHEQLRIRDLVEEDRAMLRNVFRQK